MAKFVQYKIRPCSIPCIRSILRMLTSLIGAREAASYISPMRDAIDAGLRPTNHTDFVVAPLDQLMMLYSAVNRLSRSGNEIGTGQRA